MSDQVDEVKQKIDIVELVGESVNLKKAGRHFKGLCPFHSEKSPSFIVSPERQSYKCFGCGEGGDAINFLQKYDGMSFLEALETLAKRVGITLESYRPTEQDVAKKRLLEILNLASEYYQYLLNKHEVGEPARQYLKKRGIVSETIKLYGLGYAPNQWQGVSTYLTDKKGYKWEELLAAGMVIRSDNGRYYDRFRGRVMFPLRDHKGSTVGFSGRTLSVDTKEAKYINSPETAVYHKSQMLYGLWENKQEIRKRDQLVIVEGELDVLPSYQAGIKNVVAIKGSAFTYEMGRLILRYTRNVVYALDADQAGIEAVKRAVKVAEPIDLSIRVVQIEGGKDPGDVATADPKGWREMVKGASLYWDYLMEITFAKHKAGSGEEASEISRELVPELNLITNAVTRAHYARELAKRLSVPEESIYEEMERVSKQQELSKLKQVVKRIEKGETKSRREQVEEYLLALSLQYYPQLEARLDEIESKWFVVPVIGKVLLSLKTYQGAWSIEKFASALPPEYSEIIDRTYLQDLSGVEDPQREWEKVRVEAEELYLRERLKTLSQEIGKWEGEGSETELTGRQEEFRSLSNRLSQLS